jgi:hypothetical protein
MLKAARGATEIEEEEAVAHICEECGREFPSAFGLIVHMGTHKPRKRAAA